MFENLYFIPKITKNIILLFNSLELKYRKIIFIISIFLFSTFIDLIGISILYPYISLLLDTNANTENIYFKLFSFNFISEEQKSNKILFMGIILLFVFFVKFLIALMSNYIINKFSFEQVIKIRYILANKYANISYESFIKKNTSEYLNVLNNIAGDLNTVIISFLRIVNDLILISGFIIFLLFFNFSVTSLLIIIFIFIFYLYDIFLKNRLIKFGRIINFNANLFIRKINELILGYREINVLSKQDFFVNQIDYHSKTFSKYRIIFNVINAMPKYFIELIFMVFIIILILYYSFIDIISAEELLSLIAVFLLVSIRMFPSVTGLLSNFSRLDYVKNSIEILINEIKINQIHQKSKISNIKFEFLNLSFENVSFNYDKNIKLINNINFTINKNDIVGIKGASGKGKTTLVNLIIGFLKPKSGRVLINDMQSDELSQLLSSSIAYLPQEVFLMDGTISENIALGENFDNLENKIYDSLKKANLYNYVNGLEDKIDTNIGDKGIKISGGQKQRIGIARSFFFNKEILIFDESTSSLDKKTENKIIEEILSMKGKVTIILISHNLDLFSICNQVIDLDNE